MNQKFQMVKPHFPLFWYPMFHSALKELCQERPEPPLPNLDQDTAHFLNNTCIEYRKVTQIYAQIAILQYILLNIYLHVDQLT